MRESEYLRRQADECRATALQADSQQRRLALQQLAGYYEREAMKMEIRPPVSFART
jgi:hypothetical protein